MDRWYPCVIIALDRSLELMSRPLTDPLSLRQIAEDFWPSRVQTQATATKVQRRKTYRYVNKPVLSDNSSAITAGLPPLTSASKAYHQLKHGKNVSTISTITMQN